MQYCLTFDPLVDNHNMANDVGSSPTSPARRMQKMGLAKVDDGFECFNACSVVCRAWDCEIFGDSEVEVGTGEVAR